MDDKTQYAPTQTNGVASPASTGQAQAYQSQPAQSGTAAPTMQTGAQSAQGLHGKATVEGMAISSPEFQEASQQGSPVQPQGAGHKEHAPVQEMAVHEAVKPTEIEPVIDQELKEAGVEKAPDVERPELSVAEQNAGVAHAKEAVPVPALPTTVHLPELPMTHEQVLETVKTHKQDDTVVWYAKLVDYVRQKLTFVNKD